MTALATRVLRTLAERPEGLQADEVANAYPAYRPGATDRSLARLVQAGLAVREGANAGRFFITDAGRVAANLKSPPRWSKRGA